MGKHYILDGNGNPKPVDLMTWAMWYETCDRTIARDTIGGVDVSTVFLGLDHGWGNGPPVLYETMIFGGPHNDYRERYTNRVAAIAGHDQALALVRDARQDINT